MYAKTLQLVRTVDKFKAANRFANDLRFLVEASGQPSSMETELFNLLKSGPYKLLLPF